MIIISILIHLLGNQFPNWMLPKSKQNNPILKLSGLFIDFLVAFLILFFIHLLSPKNYYIENKDAIYGFEFNDTMEKLGFEDGDKIISINNQPVKDVSKISIDIIMNANSIIKISRKNQFKELIVNDNQVMTILQAKGTPIKVKLTPSTKGEKIYKIKLTQEKFSFEKVLDSYRNNIKGVYDFINPIKDYKKISGMRSVSKNFIGQMSMLSFCSTVVGVLNLLPLPGFSLGNFIISFVESRRGKTFNFKKKNIVSLCTIFIVIVTILILHT